MTIEKTPRPSRATTSASNIFRRQLCPASARLEAGLAEEENEYAAEGTMLHELFLTGKRPKTLTDEQRETLDSADLHAHEFFIQVQRQFNIPLDAPYVDEREVTLEVRDSKGFPLFPGHADVIRTWHGYDVRALVDAKFGYLEVDQAADNTQLAAYAIGRHQMMPLGPIAVAIVQPRNFGPRMTTAVYAPESFDAVLMVLERIIEETKNPAAPAIAGYKQCHFCKAKTICPAYKETVLDVVEYGETAIETTRNDQLVELFRAIAFAKKIGDDVNNEMRARITAGTLPTFKLQNTGDVRTLNDHFALFQRLQDELGSDQLTAEAFDGCREMAWGKLEEVTKPMTGLSDKKNKEWLKEVAASFCTVTPKAKRVVPAKSLDALEGGK